jgi:uncharacterized protein YegL
VKTEGDQFTPLDLAATGNTDIAARCQVVIDQIEADARQAQLQIAGVGGLDFAGAGPVPTRGF